VRSDVLVRRLQQQVLLQPLAPLLALPLRLLAAAGLAVSRGRSNSRMAGADLL
jgi:hypothetical protein